MLKRLLAYEWKDTWKLMTILNCIVMGLTLAGSLFLLFTHLDLSEIFEQIGRSDLGILYFLSGMGFFMLYVGSIMVLTLGSMIFFFVRFYKNLYADQGYLMHTLPVGKHELIWSKILVFIVWRVISLIVICVSVSMLAYAGFGDGFTTVAAETVKAFIDEVGGFRCGVYIIILILMFMAGVLYNIFTGYLSISIGQLAHKNKVLASVGVYIGIIFVIRVLSSIFSNVFFVMEEFSEKSIIRNLLEYRDAPIMLCLVAMVIQYVICAAMYFVIYSIMNKRLNLD
ncbi:MAG: hypothetical protein K6E98_06900 [Lachnospiraceae bacterium]|nr:hypothetical protein [Lachnospiraceae bacterium]